MILKTFATDYETLFTLSVDLLCVFHHDGTILKINPAVKDMLGYEPDYLINRSLFDFVHKDDIPLIRAELGKQLKENLPSINVEIRCRTAQNGYATLVWSGRTNPNDMIAYVVGRDIRREKRLEQTAEEEHQRYEQAINVGNIGIWDWDIKTDTVYMDNQLKELLGLQHLSDTNGLEAWHQRVHPEDEPLVSRRLKEYLDDDHKPLHLTYRMEHGDGGWRWIETRAQLLRDDNNQPYRMIGADLDITERINRELAIGKQRNILKAISRGAEHLIDDPDLPSAINKTLAEVGKAVKVSRVYIYENSFESPGRTVYRQRYEWCADGIAPGLEDPATQNLSYQETGCSRWLEQLSNRKVISGPTNEFPAGEQIASRKQNILSICAVPIFIANYWWGFIGLDDCTSARVWEQGEVEALQSIAHLIGSAINRINTERTLQSQEEQLRSIYDNTMIGLYRTTETGEILMVNLALANLLGYSGPQELLDAKRAVNDFLPYYHRKKFLSILKKKKEIRNFETMWRKKDGTPIYINEHARLIPSKDPNNNWIEGSIEDITDRKLAEQALSESQAQLADAQKIGRFGHWEYQLRKQRISWSEEVNKIYKPGNETADTVDEKTFLELHHPDDRTLLKKSMEEAVATKASLELDCRVRRDSGQVKYIHIIISPIVNKADKVYKLFGTIQDITERKITEEQVIKNQKLESIGLLAGGIAHDFNNLLTGILGNVALVKTELEPDDDLYYHLDEAERATVHAKDLTTQLLTFSSGGKPIKKPTELIPLVRNAVNLMTKGHNVIVDYQFPAKIDPVYIDAGQIRQVIYNVILNARQAMPEGGLLKISLENCTVTGQKIPPLSPGAYVKMTCCDEGIGIPVENVNKIFDPYFTTKANGNGLGLATVYSIIKKHNGCIKVTSKKGDGTTMIIYLPVSTEPVPEIESLKTVESHANVKTGRLLVMDDEEFIRALARRVLTKEGYTVDCVPDGESAIKQVAHVLAQNSSYDVAILDLTIAQGMGGKETVSHLKKLDKNIKAIVCSGYSNDPVMSVHNQYGFDAVVAKPYRPQELLDAVKRSLKS